MVCTDMLIAGLYYNERHIFVDDKYEQIIVIKYNFSISTCIYINILATMYSAMYWRDV